MGSPFIGNLIYSFLLLIVTLECYHLVLSKRGACTPKEDNQAFLEIDKLLTTNSGLSPETKDFWQSYKGKLNQKPLKLQLEDIYQFWKEIMDILGFLRKDEFREKFFKGIRDQRNHIAHGRKERIETQALHESFYRVRLFLELRLLGEMGFTPKECQEIIRRAWYFKQFSMNI